MDCLRTIYFSLLIIFVLPLSVMGGVEEELTALYGSEFYKKDPHWVKERCDVCHKGQPQKSELFLRGDPNTVCTVCHKKDRASEEIHPSGIKTPENMLSPKEFPYDSEGRSTCLTCHDHIRACLLVDKKKDKDFLRGGPYVNRLEVCYKCHKKEDVKAYNPHEEQIKDNKIADNRCLFCHSKVLDTTRRITDGSYELRRKMSVICVGCHLFTPHAGAFEHLERPNEKTLDVMRGSEKRLGIVFPLDEQGRLTCVTCHNPHESGIFPQGAAPGVKHHEDKLPESVQKNWDRKKALIEKDWLYKTKSGQEVLLSIRDLAPRAEKNMRISARSGKLCLACHPYKAKSERLK